MTNQRPQLTINVTLSEIYACLCPTCKAALLDLFGEKVGTQNLREFLRRQLEASAHPEPVEGPPGEHH